MTKRKFWMICGFASVIAFTVVACDDDSTQRTVAECGNGVLEAGEQCDGTLFLNGRDICQQVDAKYTSGNLICTQSCQIDTSACKMGPVSEDCGNARLDVNEDCDGALFRDEKTSCSQWDAQYVSGDVSCTSACALDMSACEKQVVSEDCGNNQLDEGEDCDGALFRDEKTSCSQWDAQYVSGDVSCTSACALDMSACEKQAVSEDCGNNQLDEGEDCDGALFRDEKTSCSQWDAQYVSGDVSCTSACALDMSACEKQAVSEDCGNNQLDEGEDCDGALFRDEKTSCSQWDAQYVSGDVSCTTACALDMSACQAAEPGPVIFSEAVIERIEVIEQAVGFGIELYNVGTDYDLSQCQLEFEAYTAETVGGKVKYTIDASKTQTFDFGAQSLASHQTVVVCNQPGKLFVGGDKCTHELPESWKTADMGIAWLKCGGARVDMMPFGILMDNVPLSAVLNVRRFCSTKKGFDHFFNTDGETFDGAALGDWSASYDAYAKSKFDLGSHCLSAGKTLVSCQGVIEMNGQQKLDISKAYTKTDPQELEAEIAAGTGTTVKGKLMFKVEGATDVSDGNDIRQSIMLVAVFRDSTTTEPVAEERFFSLSNDDSWQNTEGIDQYTFEEIVHKLPGFGIEQPLKEGDYYLDFLISLDNGETFKACGPTKIFDPAQGAEGDHHILAVGNLCGDNYLDQGENCDGDKYLNGSFCTGANEEYDSCSNDCKTPVCKNTEPVSKCKDGVSNALLHSSEACDANMVPVDACGDAEAQVGATCTQQCELDTSTCGSLLAQWFFSKPAGIFGCSGKAIDYLSAQSGVMKTGAEIRVLQFDGASIDTDDLKLNATKLFVLRDNHCALAYDEFASAAYDASKDKYMEIFLPKTTGKVYDHVELAIDTRCFNKNDNAAVDIAYSIEGDSTLTTLVTGEKIGEAATASKVYHRIDVALPVTVSTDKDITVRVTPSNLSDQFMLLGRVYVKGVEK